MQGVSLRLARPADAAAMTVMQRASWLAAYGEVLGADMASSDGRLKNFFQLIEFIAEPLRCGNDGY